MKPDIRDLVSGILMLSVGLFVARYASSHYQVGSAAPRENILWQFFSGMD